MTLSSDGYRSLRRRSRRGSEAEKTDSTQRHSAMLSRSCIIVFTACTLLAKLASPAVAEPTFPAGLRVGLEPPAGLSPSSRFPGFENVEQKVSIAILDLPSSAYAELETAAFGKIQREFDQTRRESFPFANGIGFLISGRKQHDGIMFHRWSLLAQAVGGPVHDLTALINVEVPEEAIQTYSDELIRKTLASVTFRPAPIQEQLGLLPFKFGGLAGFEVRQVLPTGVVILADGKSEASSRSSLMILSIGRSGPRETADRSRFARDLLANTPVRDLAVQSAEPMRIGGSPGHEIRAKAKGPAGEPMSLVQWVRFGSGGFLRIVGMSPATEWDQTFGRFREVRDGIEMR